MDGEQARLRGNSRREVARDEFAGLLVVEWLRILLHRNVEPVAVDVDDAIAIGVLFHHKIVGNGRIVLSFPSRVSRRDVGSSRRSRGTSGSLADFCPR